MNKILNIIRKKKNILNTMENNKKFNLRDLPRVKVNKGNICEGYLFKVLPSICGDSYKITTVTTALIIKDDNTTVSVKFNDIEFIN